MSRELKDEQSKLLALLFFVLLLCLSAYKSYQAYRYKTEAEVLSTKVIDIREARNRRRLIGYNVCYWVPRERKRPFEGYTTVPVADQHRFKVGDTVEVLVLWDRFPKTCIRGYEPVKWVVVFGALVIVIGAMCVWLYRSTDDQRLGEYV